MSIRILLKDTVVGNNTPIFDKFMKSGSHCWKPGNNAHVNSVITLTKDTSVRLYLKEHEYAMLGCKSDVLGNHINAMDYIICSQN